MSVAGVELGDGTSIAPGVELGLRAFADVAAVAGLPFFVGVGRIDGAQVVPHLPVDVRAIGCDFYVSSGPEKGGSSSVRFFYGQAKQLEALPIAEGGSLMAKSVDFEQVTPSQSHKVEGRGARLRRGGGGVLCPGDNDSFVTLRRQTTEPHKVTRGWVLFCLRPFVQHRSVIRCSSRLERVIS